MNDPFLPRTAEEMIEFIGSQFSAHQFAKEDGTPLPPDMNRFTLTVHDLLSAFRWAGWYDDEEEEPMPVGEPWTDEQMASLRAWAKAADEESILRRAEEIKAERATLPVSDPIEER